MERLKKKSDVQFNEVTLAALWGGRFKERDKTEYLEIQNI